TWYVRREGEVAAPSEFQRAFDAVRDGIAAGHEALRAGVTGVQVDTPARVLVEERGYRFTHALGHQIGRTLHAARALLGPNNERYGDRSSGTVEPGMVFTLEPVIGPIGLEENVVVTAEAADYLVPPQTKIILI